MTDDIIIRPYMASDIPSLCNIWQSAFGDEKALLEKFFELLPDMGKGIVAENGSEVIGMLYILDAKFGANTIGYVYAVAVKNECRSRGIGRLLCETASQMDYDIIATLPAEKGLYAWYEKVLRTSLDLYVKYEKLLPCDGEAYNEIDATEYGKIRSKLLCGKNHIEFPENYLRFQEEICRSYGGGMFAGADGIACGYIDDGVLCINEALGETAFLPAVCKDLGASCAVIRAPSCPGEAFIAATGNLPDDCEWNLALD